MSTAMFNGRAVLVVPNHDPNLRVGVATFIFDDPMSRENQEGLAVLREIDERRTNEDFVEARIEFQDEEGEYYWRRIYRHA